MAKLKVEIEIRTLGDAQELLRHIIQQINRGITGGTGWKIGDGPVIDSPIPSETAPQNDQNVPGNTDAQPANSSDTGDSSASQPTVDSQDIPPWEENNGPRG